MMLMMNADDGVDNDVDDCDYNHRDNLSMLIMLIMLKIMFLQMLLILK